MRVAATAAARTSAPARVRSEHPPWARVAPKTYAVVAARMSDARAAHRSCARAASARPCRSGFASGAWFDARARVRAAAQRTAASARGCRSVFVNAASWNACSPRALALGCSMPARAAARALLRRERAAPLRRRHPNQYRCRQWTAESKAAECAVARSRLRRLPRRAAWTTCDQERWSAQLPPYSRLFLGLTHRKCRQAMEAFGSSEKMAGQRRAPSAIPVQLAPGSDLALLKPRAPPKSGLLAR